ncbi:MAG TPA: NAD(P)H-dependent oxidoreductase subunit E [Syntrophobacteraceae bacterium]|nr:NAD(P)H-dependent oxidoreductase subunit E [Syntrophobacteraceae bacterium]
MELNLTDVDAIIDHWGPKPDSLLQIMLDINHRFRFLPRESMERVAERLRMPVSQVFGVANFFKVFRLKPQGRVLVHVCTGTACHVKGTPRLLDRIQQDLHLRPGDTTEDLSLTLETVNCVGACASAPVVVVDGVTYGQATPTEISQLAKKLMETNKA